MKLRSFAVGMVIVVSYALATPANADDMNQGKAATSDKAKRATKLSADDRKLVVHQHHVHKMEIDLGKLAQKRGGDAVKRYGETLVRDHQTADKELAAFAKKRGLARIPREKPTTEAEQKERQDMKSAVARMKKLTGAEFDRAFLAMMIMDHEKEIGRVETAITTATDPELQTLLRDVKPLLQRHADMARELQRGGAQASAGPTSGPSAK